jgi:hypothetical protein
MRTIRKNAVGVCLFLLIAFGGNAVAAPTAQSGDSALVKIKRLIVHILEDIKASLPPG